MRWDGSARLICNCPAGASPPPPASRNPGTPATCAEPPSLSLRDPAGVVAIRSPASRRLARPARGAMGGQAYDRPHGRCNAAHCLGTDCHVAVLPAIIMCFHTTINERPPLSSARRSRRISCTGACCVGTLLREILRLWLRMTCRGCGGCFITMTVSGV